LGFLGFQKVQSCENWINRIVFITICLKAPHNLAIKAAGKLLSTGVYHMAMPERVVETWTRGLIYASKLLIYDTPLKSHRTKSLFTFISNHDFESSKFHEYPELLGPLVSL